MMITYVGVIWAVSSHDWLGFKFFPPEPHRFLILVVVYIESSRASYNIQESLLLIRSLFLNFIGPIMGTHPSQIRIHDLHQLDYSNFPTAYQVFLHNVLIFLHQPLYPVTWWAFGERLSNQLVVQIAAVLLPNFLESGLVDFVLFLQLLNFELGYWSKVNKIQI